MKPRIVILSAFLTPFRSGAEACAEEVARRAADRYDITIITARFSRSLPQRDCLWGTVPVVRLGFGCAFDKWLFPFLAPFAARRLRPDIIHAVLESYAGLALVFCKRLCATSRRILTCQSTNTTLLLGSMHLVADRVTVISSVLVERAKKFGRFDVHLIPNGISLPEIERFRTFTKKVPGRILFVGRLERMKGVDILLKAFAGIQNSEFKIHHLHLHIVGDGSERSNLECLARDLGIWDRVTFVGRMQPPDIYQEFAQAEIFCALSRSEALGNVFLEAQAAGCAVIGTKVGGIPDIVTDGETGILVPSESPDDAREALLRLLTDSELRGRLAAAGVRNASRYDWSVIAERYVKVYEELLR